MDVVFQRLDGLNLSNHVALVHDEKLDRKNLYTKIESVLTQNQVSFEQAVSLLASTSSKLSAQEDLLNSIANALYEYQDFGLRLYDLYGLANPVGETTQIIELKEVIGAINKDSLDDISEKVYTYAEWYDRFGYDGYPLKIRKSYAQLNMKDKLEAVELLTELIAKAKTAVQYLNSLDHDQITPAYTWLIENKLDKIYPDLEDGQKRTLQGLRIWWWTTVSGKAIIEQLIEGEKFTGTSSPEWLKIKKALVSMHQIAKETRKMAEEIEKLKRYIDDVSVEALKNRISDGEIPLSDLDKILEYIHRDFEDLQQMDTFWTNSSDIVKKVIVQLQHKTTIDHNLTLADSWVDLLRNSAYVHWIDQTEKKYPEVQKISTSEFARIRDSFAKLIEEKRTVATQFLIHSLTKKVDTVQFAHSKSVRELKHQVSKKRMIWSLRKLVNEFAADSLVDIMPVWLASPEIVSSIFPLKEGLFDLVIFDEASQCTVESGIPAVYRAKQLIVAGDEKQLPPFNMFQSSFVNEDEEEEQYDTDESVSLLNLAKRRFPEKILQWHYRSKYEELINYSNHAFYNGHVQIAPNVIPFKNPPAIQWKKVEGRWNNQSNEEAIEVVTLLKDILINQTGKSVGIITFNSKQQTKIMDIIEKLSNEDEEFRSVYNQVMAKDLDERIFVKNIENVQGDERDIILFSIGYAKNEEGKIYNRFGMLNQKGGENRLNVAVTRAKEGIIVVSSIEPEELNVANTTQLGPKLLKTYLKYVRAVSGLHSDEINAVVQEINENVNTHVQVQELHFDSPFEEQVYKQLTNLGYSVTTQVGMSGYRIDMAIVHPKDPSRYILGVECDGAMYHSSLNAKERDVYRQRFLESRGWTIERIWSRNWWKNPGAEIERIDQKVKELLKSIEVREKVSN
ncbi:AAA domain-containing protein [Peribacillus sp. SCS-155]|uniref:AAA domain-containing protein n=1 Tax=Peribacillus sedimenti TaxID=3115297 RepID=UPI003906551F